jgi:hypothetical protein
MSMKQVGWSLPAAIHQGLVLGFHEETHPANAVPRPWLFCGLGTGVDRPGACQNIQRLFRGERAMDNGVKLYYNLMQSFAPFW